MAIIRGITIEIEGKTSGLTKALKDVDIQLKNTSKAINDIDKALELDPTNVELLATKEQLLAQQTDLATQRLDILRQVQKDALDKLPQDSADSAAKMATLQAEIATTEQNISGMSDESKDASKNVENLGAEAKTAGDKAEKSGEDFEKFGKAAKVAAEVAAAAVAALAAGVAAAGKALAECTANAASYADEILTLSTQTGIATDDLQAYKYAAELVDVSLETLTGSMAKNIKSMTSVQSGQKAMTAAYAALGVSAVDANGKLRDSDTVYWELIAALGQIEDETEKDALAMQIFGKSAQDLNPLIAAGADAMKNYKKEAELVGYVMSSETLSSFGEFDDSMQRLQLGATAAQNALGAILLPLLTQLGGEGTSLLTEFTTQLNSTGGDISAMSAIIETMLPNVLGVIQNYLPQIFELASSIIGVILTGLISALPTLLPVASDLILTLVNGIIEVLPTLVPVAVDTILTLAEGLLQPETLQNLINAAVTIITTLADGLTKRLPDLIGIAYEAIITIQSSLIENLPQILVAAAKIIGALVLGIVQNLPLIVSKGPEILEAYMKAIESIPGAVTEAARTWGADMIDNFVNGISRNMKKLKEKCYDVANLVKSILGFSCPEIGPLSNFDKSGPDMIDLFAEGMTKELPTLENALTKVGNVILNGTQVDYSSQLSSISGALAGMGNSQIIVPVSIGGTKLDSVIVNAVNNSNYRSGGR